MSNKTVHIIIENKKIENLYKFNYQTMWINCVLKVPKDSYSQSYPHYPHNIFLDKKIKK